MKMDTSIRFRWLGTGGIELVVNDQVLLVDPYFTRFPLRKLVLGRVHPDRALIRDTIKHADYVLLSHAHFDHLMDVPDLVQNTGAVAIGSPNSCQLLAVCGVAERKIREAHAGDCLGFGDYQVEVLKAEHLRIPLFAPGRLSHALEPPLRARDYRMDFYYSFLISAGGHRLLTDPGTCPDDAVAADVLFVHPGMPRPFYESLLPHVRPQVVVPYHWDDFFHPLSLPLRPFWRPPERVFRPLRRVNLAEFGETVEGIAPGAALLEPEVYRSYDLVELLGRS
jgi:L-ascorbate metabolism protein UlaG (beta-lactamase superfamily)